MTKRLHCDERAFGGGVDRDAFRSLPSGLAWLTFLCDFHDLPVSKALSFALDRLVCQLSNSVKPHIYSDRYAFRAAVEWRADSAKAGRGLGPQARRLGAERASLPREVRLDIRSGVTVARPSFGAFARDGQV